ncbi:MAG: HYR domain-containing protein, partial [Bacteroidota bacterium]
VNATAPTLTLTSCPEDITSDGNVVSWAEPTASSTCFTGLLKIEQTEGPANGSAFPAGTTRVSYLIADECDNTEVCFFNVTVTGDTGCATPNITLLNVPTDVSVACDAIPVVANVTTQGGCGTVNVDFIEEMVGDNCAGTITRTWTATDSEGNSSTASQTISISDTTAPVLSGVPADVTHPKGQPLPTAPQVTATDNCDNNVVITFDEVTGSDVVTRTWTAVDNCGNIVEATQTITLIDDNSCPAAGTPCDDNDPNTENDVQDGNCNCNGTPIQTVCDLGFNISAVTCNNNGTQTEPNDDQFTFDLVVFNPAGGTGYTVDGVSYEYGVTYTFGNYPIANGAATIVVYDIDNSGCSDVVTVDAPAPCTTACDITASAANVVCNDNGTPSDPSDDTFTFDLTVTGVGNPWAFMVGSEVYDYDVAHPFGPFLIANGDINLVVVDKDNPTCTDEIRISAPATCSDQPVQNCNKEVLFVVGRLNLNSGDRAAKERLEHLGLNVTLVDDDFSQTSDANGKGLIVVSSTVSSGRVKAKYRDLAIPFVTWEA